MHQKAQNKDPNCCCCPCPGKQSQRASPVAAAVAACIPQQVQKWSPSRYPVRPPSPSPDRALLEGQNWQWVCCPAGGMKGTGRNSRPRKRRPPPRPPPPRFQTTNSSNAGFTPVGSCHSRVEQGVHVHCQKISSRNVTVPVPSRPLPPPPPSGVQKQWSTNQPAQQQSVHYGTAVQSSAWNNPASYQPSKAPYSQQPSNITSQARPYQSNARSPSPQYPPNSGNQISHHQYNAGSYHSSHYPPNSGSQFPQRQPSAASYHSSHYPANSGSRFQHEPSAISSRYQTNGPTRTPPDPRSPSPRSPSPSYNRVPANYSSYQQSPASQNSSYARNSPTRSPSPGYQPSSNTPPPRPPSRSPTATGNMQSRPPSRTQTTGPYRTEVEYEISNPGGPPGSSVKIGIVTSANGGQTTTFEHPQRSANSGYMQSQRSTNSAYMQPHPSGNSAYLQPQPSTNSAYLQPTRSALTDRGIGNRSISPSRKSRSRSRSRYSRGPSSYHRYGQAGAPDVYHADPSFSNPFSALSRPITPGFTSSAHTMGGHSCSRMTTAARTASGRIQSRCGTPAGMMSTMRTPMSTHSPSNYMGRYSRSPSPGLCGGYGAKPVGMYPPPRTQSAYGAGEFGGRGCCYYSNGTPPPRPLCPPKGGQGGMPLGCVPMLPRPCPPAVGQGCVPDPCSDPCRPVRRCRRKRKRKCPPIDLSQCRDPYVPNPKSYADEKHGCPIEDPCLTKEQENGNIMECCNCCWYLNCCHAVGCCFCGSPPKRFRCLC